MREAIENSHALRLAVYSQLIAVSLLVAVAIDKWGATKLWVAIEMVILATAYIICGLGWWLRKEPYAIMLTFRHIKDLPKDGGSLQVLRGWTIFTPITPRVMGNLALLCSLILGWSLVDGNSRLAVALNFYGVPSPAWLTSAQPTDNVIETSWPMPQAVVSDDHRWVLPESATTRPNVVSNVPGVGLAHLVIDEEEGQLVFTLTIEREPGSPPLKDANIYFKELAPAVTPEESPATAAEAEGEDPVESGG
ncbi:MAG: hypothetical protein HY461_01470 [Parcubacteria group bacterium]|nr:hypothetical protein [Parcubacteria group bacterium]